MWWCRFHGPWILLIQPWTFLTAQKMHTRHIPFSNDYSGKWWNKDEQQVNPQVSFHNYTSMPPLFPLPPLFQQQLTMPPEQNLQLYWHSLKWTVKRQVSWDSHLVYYANYWKYQNLLWDKNRIIKIQQYYYRIKYKQGVLGIRCYQQFVMHVCLTVTIVSNVWNDPCTQYHAYLLVLKCYNQIHRSC